MRTWNRHLALLVALFTGIVTLLATATTPAGAAAPTPNAPKAAAGRAAALGFWLPCTPDDLRQALTLRLLGRTTDTTPAGRIKSTYNGTNAAIPMKATYGEKISLSVQTSVGGSVEAEKVVKVALEAGWSQTVVKETTEADEYSPIVPPGSYIHLQPFVTNLFVLYEVAANIELRYWMGVLWCRGNKTPSFRTAKIPIAETMCVWTGPAGTHCPPEGRGRRGGGGAPPPGGTPAPPTGPQPVTSVHGLADGTLLSTTDTGRVYKMVGGAPVWQATCGDGICTTTPRPTTQAVINAGPATPRNGATVIDQRGRIHLFVGGAPLWQETCASPVTCGTPIKVSSWSVDARDHMNTLPADGQLVQAKAGPTDLPVSATVGGALVPFGSPQEVIDSGHGADWARKVVAISPGSYNNLGAIPADGTLVQGAANGVSTPVAMILGGAAIPFGSPQEVIDSGYGSNWPSKVQGIPARHFHTLPTIPKDGTLIQGSLGSTPVAAIMGGGRVNFAGPQEVIDSGFGTDWASKVRGIPGRAFSALPTRIVDGTRLAKSGATSEAAVIGGARVDFHNEGERDTAGYGDKPRQVIPARVWDAMPTTITDGTRLARSGATSEAAVIGGARVDFHNEWERDTAGYGDKPRQVVPARVWDAMTTQVADGTLLGRSDSTAQGAVVGGAMVPFQSMEELEGAGYGAAPLLIVPPRVWDALPTRIADGTRLAKSGATSEAAVIGGARVDFHTGAERDAAGYGTTPRQVVPARVWDALPTSIGDGTRIKDAGSSGQAAIVGGAKVTFAHIEELTASGYADRPMQVVPNRVWTALTTRIADGTRIKDAGSSGQAAIVGGAKVTFANIEELNASGYADRPLQVVPNRIWTALTTRIADGTRIKSPDASTVWLVEEGRRTVTAETAGAWTIPQRVIDTIPLG
ncbi:hypothetical protein [Streptomyces sp. NPDC097619]|uniref:hypothetical protein n=1 Tax=Streptomyces sp. NPDC097619 TaxID=3157228 RepID=UPI003333351E